MPPAVSIPSSYPFTRSSKQRNFSQSPNTSSIRHKKEAYKPSPLMALPPELLYEIFVRCLPAATQNKMVPVPSRRQAPLSLAGVCKLWRIIVEDIPVLWTSLTIADDISESPLPPHRRLQEALQWLARAKNAPLSLSFRTMHRYNDVFMIQIILPFLSQTRSLNLNIPLYFYFPFSGLPNGAGPILEKLSFASATFNSPYIPDGIDLQSLFPLLSAATFRMRSIYTGFIGGSIIRNVPWSRLRVLDIQEPDIDIFKLQGAIAACPNLASCSVQVARAPILSIVLSNPLRTTLPQLQHLAVEFKEVGYVWRNDQTIAFFEPFTFPALKSLTMEGTSVIDNLHHFPASSLSDLLERSGTSLETLTIRHFDFVKNINETVRFFKSLTRLTTLNLKVNIAACEDAHLQLRFLLNTSYKLNRVDRDALPNLEHFSLECVQQRGNSRPPMTLAMTRELGIGGIFHFLELRVIPPKASRHAQWQARLKTADLKWVDVPKVWGGLSNAIVERAEELKRYGLGLKYEVRHHIL